MNMLSDYDLKQIALLNKRIDFFDGKIKLIELYYLCSFLTGVLNCIETVDNYWKRELQAAANTLEMVYDSIEDGSISKWNEEPEVVVNKSISKLKFICNFLLDERLKLSDQSISNTALLLDINWLMCPKCNESWKRTSTQAMVFCPSCYSILHNPMKGNTKDIGNARC